MKILMTEGAIIETKEVVYIISSYEKAKDGKAGKEFLEVAFKNEASVRVFFESSKAAIERLAELHKEIKRGGG